MWMFSSRSDEAKKRVYSEFENPPYFYIMVIKLLLKI